MKKNSFLERNPINANPEKMQHENDLFPVLGKVVTKQFHFKNW